MKNLFPNLKAPTVSFSRKSRRLVYGEQPVGSVRKSSKVDSERWITLNGKEDDGHGVHVKISGDGKIVAGPSGLADKGIRSLSDFGKAKDDDRKHVTTENEQLSAHERASRDIYHDSIRSVYRNAGDTRIAHGDESTAHRIANVAGAKVVDGGKLFKKNFRNVADAAGADWNTVNSAVESRRTVRRIVS